MLDLIRSGKAPEVIRRKGAEGTLPLPAEDRIEILAFLAIAPEADLRKKALETFEEWDRAEVRRIMASPMTAPGVLRFGAQQALAGCEELREILLWNPSLPSEFRSLLQPKPTPQATAEPASLIGPAPLPTAPIAEAASVSPPQAESESAPATSPDEEGIQLLASLAAGGQLEDVDAPPEVTKHDDELTAEDRETLIQKVGRMTVVEKIKAALTGNLETRSLLIRDSNKIVSRAVLQSPRISDSEAEGYAAAKNVSEEVLRLISLNRKFMKCYVVMRALINNPRAPLNITIPLVPRMNDRDLKGLAINRNVPEVLRSLAIKAIKQKEEANKPRLPGRH